mmetsp:Transcript_41194/g.94750  ORF Transcript_41194/g.94750 Transcript_41194/m.94750 type:complete len:405 (-) Transcript_41194:42-1256(-)
MQPQLSSVVIRNALQKCAAEVGQAEKANPTTTNLDFFHPDAPLLRAPDGEFTFLRKLHEGNLRTAFHCRWTHAGQHEEVVVKVAEAELIHRIGRRARNDRTAHFAKRFDEAEDILGEIGVLEHLSRQPDVSEHIISMRAAFTTWTSDIWLVTEYAGGGELFHLVADAEQQLSECTVCKYIEQLLHALGFLHRHSIAHRDVSLENILLKDGNAKLMDFGAACTSHSPCGTPLRYFQGVGKPFYRAPEACVPQTQTVSVRAAACATAGGVSLVQVMTHLIEVRWPEDVKAGEVCSAEVFGYAAAPLDIFAAAVCMFILAWRTPPWTDADLGDHWFATAFRARSHSGLEVLLQQWRKRPLSPSAMQLLNDMARFEPSVRPTADSCLESAWFQKQREPRDHSTAVGGS